MHERPDVPRLNLPRDRDEEVRQVMQIARVIADQPAAAISSSEANVSESFQSASESVRRGDPASRAAHQKKL